MGFLDFLFGKTKCPRIAGASGARASEGPSSVPESLVRENFDVHATTRASPAEAD